MNIFNPSYPKQGLYLQVFFIIALLSLPMLAQYNYPTACSDNFEETLNPAWTFVDYDNHEGSSAKIQDGKLWLNGWGFDTYKNHNEFIGIFRNDLTGNFDISVRIDTQTATHSWAQTGIMVANNIMDLSEGGYGFLEITPKTGVRVFYDSKSPVGFTDKNIRSAKSTKFPMFLRLIKTDTTFFGLYKHPDSNSWQEASNFSPLLTQKNSHVGLFSFSHDSVKAGTVIFDDFTCYNESGQPLTNIKTHGFTDEMEIKKNDNQLQIFLNVTTPHILKLMNIRGQIVATQVIQSREKMVQFPIPANGLYILSVSDGLKNNIKSKIIPLIGD